MLKNATDYRFIFLVILIINVFWALFSAEKDFFCHCESNMGNFDVKCLWSSRLELHNNSFANFP